MRLFINGVEVGDADVITKTNGQTLALMQNTEVAILLDDLQDRTRVDAILNTASSYRFSGDAGTFWAGEIANHGWCVWADGAEKYVKTMVSRSQAIELAFDMAHAAQGSRENN